MLKDQYSSVCSVPKEDIYSPEFKKLYYCDCGNELMCAFLRFHPLCLFLFVSPCVSGQWRLFSGNELGALLGWWMFRCWKQQNTDAAAVKNLYMLSSTVSSKILRAIALKEGFHFEVTQSNSRL